MRQFREQKREVGDALLLFRMGDFYELFYDDAETAARILGIALTSRDGGRTPLAGIPYHALETYLARLVAAGFKVAISEQVAEARPGKIVEREIVRVVTPGTLTDEALLDRRRSNILAAFVEERAEVGVAALELSTGEFVVLTCCADDLLNELTRLAPAELLLSDKSGREAREAAIRDQVGCVITYRSDSDFFPSRAEELLRTHFETVALEGFGFERMDASLRAAGALLTYTLETQRAAARHLQPPRRRHLAEVMVLDATTLRSLELERTLRSGAREGSLLAAVDRTSNPMGARLLRNWICYPLRRIDCIRLRQQLIAALRDDRDARRQIRDTLANIGDIERMVGRLGVQRTTPREMRAVGDALAQLPGVRARLERLPVAGAADLARRLEGLDDLAGSLCATLRPDAPTTVRDGGIFADGFHAELDRIRRTTREDQAWLARYQAQEAERTGISSLKVAYNKVFGYYIEITNTHRNRVPPEYARKQTVKNAERYVTDELKRYETQAISAESRANELEHELFGELREQVAARIPDLQRAISALAEIDVLAGWAELSLDRRYCQPEFVETPTLEIVAGRHPVIEPLLDAAFVANDTHLAAGCTEHDGADSTPRTSLALITGPNMAGKSTYIRQVALLTLMAHCGCWVPAERMRIGPVDRIFTRVGAADEIARGQSTFMVEMLETANILHNASSASLVILDEIGRGTSTFDGLALAWAITEHLAARIGCRALFATHYHELTELAGLLENVCNLNVAVREFENQIVFLHRIVAGAAGMSYGLHVARLAGVPHAVLERANAVLNELEKTFARESQRPSLAAVQRRRTRQLRLFEAPEEAVVRELRELPPTAQQDPEAARAAIRRWRSMLGF